MVSTTRKTTPLKTARTAKTTQAVQRSTPPVRKTAPVQPAATPVEEKTAKTKKPKLVRDSFTIPKAEYAELDGLKQRAVALAYPVKKSELLRAGIKALTALSDTALLAALKAVPTIKTGRPKKA